LLNLAPVPRRKDYTDVIQSIREQSAPAPGTLVETYLRGRGITISLPSSLRFHPSLWNIENQTRLPGMIAERCDVTGRVTTVHRTFLQYDGSRKAAVSKPRLDLGNTHGTAIRLSPVSNELMIGEGIETVLSAMQLYGLPGWAAGNARAVRDLNLPSAVKSVVILADNDRAGTGASSFAAQRWLSCGLRVRIARAPVGNDFNDTLLARAST
jgi:hypothetical protein